MPTTRKELIKKSASRAANLADGLIVRIRSAIYQGVYVPGQRPTTNNS